jgi:choline dehydrogenase
MADAEDTFDYIVAGAGSAGCVVAARLSESGDFRVLLLEAGPEDKAFWIKVPMGYPMLFTDPKVNWMFETEPEPELNNRRMYQPRGKVLGGTSSINGMLYIRGNPLDYDDWARMGNEGWGWRDVLPYFKKAEDQTRGGDQYHGVGGPLTVSNQEGRFELAEAIVDAAVAAGLPRNSDFNGPTQDGAGYFQTTTRDRKRLNTSQAYLKPARRRENLKIVTCAYATKVLLSNGAATGIEYRTQAGLRQAVARREVIVCGGAFGSPHLLLLSGIGPAAEIASCGIKPIHDLPGVGKNLRDHFYASLMFRCSKAITINDIVGSPVKKLLAGMEYVFLRRGPLSTNGIYAGVFARSDAGKDRPDIQINTNLWSAESRTKAGMKAHPFSGFTMSAVHLDPHSRGSVKLGSSDPFKAPEIRMNFFKCREDIEVMIKAVQLVRRIAAQRPLKDYVVAELSPSREARSAEEIEAYLRRSAIANLHSVGSCRMGTEKDAVVDARLRVHGIRGLRVVDASVMPALPSGNTNAPTIMIAEKAADMILADARTLPIVAVAQADARAEALCAGLTLMSLL